MAAVNSRNTTLTRACALAAAGALALSSCGGSEEETAPSPSPSPSVSPSPSSTVPVPDDVQLTDVGADLSFGDSATVIFEPNQKRGTVLELTVEKAAQGRVKDFSEFVLDDYTRSATPYYVDVTVENVGEGDVGGAGVPLWGVDGDNTLLPAATFTSSFGKCPSRPLPDEFGPGKGFETCLVYLAPDRGTLEGVSFRPNQAFDPILWTGDIAEPKKPERDDKAGGKKDGDEKDGGKKDRKQRSGGRGDKG
jgi:hypothetical protein